MLPSKKRKINAFELFNTAIRFAFNQINFGIIKYNYMNKIRKIAFLTEKDPLDKRSFSGTYYRMFVALQNETTDVIPIGPIKLPFINFLLKVFQRIIHTIFKKKYNAGQSILLSKIYAIVVKKRLRNHKIDIIFAPTASPLIAYLKTEIPIFYYSDATFNVMVDYYDHFSNLINFSIKESHVIEKRAIKNSQASIFASDWAANDAISTYKSDPEKTYVIKMGANIDVAPETVLIENKLSKTRCNLLFMGVEWKRKGGDIVIKTLDILINLGFDTQLVVCGCTPPMNHSNMTVYPFLNKNKEEDYKIFTQLLEDAHFLFVPTRAECSAIVFCEASANGIPSITTDTGGVSANVKHGYNGYTLPLSATPNEYATLIANTFTDKKLYKQLSENCREKYFKESNWNVWGMEIDRLITNTLK